MGDLGEAKIMPLEIAVQRELAYRRKVVMLMSPSDSNFVRELRPMEVQPSSAAPSPNPTPNSGSSAQISGVKRQVPITNCVEPLPASPLHKLEDRPDHFFCKVCQVPCPGYANYKQHIKGKKHRKSMLELKLGKKVDDKQAVNPRLWCELCKLWCMNEDALEAHLAGQKHKSAEANPQLAKNSGKHLAITREWCEVCGIPCSNVEALKMHFNGKKHKAELQKLENVRIRGGGGEIVKQKHWCELCNIWCSDKDSLNRHCQGKRHILQLHMHRK